MASENIGAKEDLALNAEDADKVVGGKKKKAVAKKKPVALKGINIQPAGGPVAGTQSQADYEAAYDKDMVEHGLDPVYGTTPSE